jgi:hypothetical protein
MILTEDNFNGILKEDVSEGDNKKLYLKGVFMEAEQQNRNGRVYALHEMEQQVKKVNEAAKTGRHILGELDHSDRLDIKLENVSHKIEQLWFEGNNVYGKALVLDKHPKGQILKALLDSEVNVGVSSRGSGSVNESDGRVSNFNLMTIDAVATPSARSAYPESIMEQLQMNKRGEIIEDLSEAVIHDPMAQKYFAIEMKKFIETLRSK